jgi:hypothetical protein
LNGAFEASVKINGQEVMNQKFSSENILEVVEKEIKLSDLLGNNLDNEISASKSGEGRMYFDMNMEYYLPLEAVKAMDQGLQISQQYFNVNDKDEAQPLNSAKVGENLESKNDFDCASGQPLCNGGGFLAGWFGRSGFQLKNF